MSNPVSGTGGRYRRFWEQRAEVARRLGIRLDVEPTTATPESDVAPRFVYEARQILCSPAAQRWANERQRLTWQRSQPADGLVKVELEEGLHIPSEVDRLNREYAEDGQRAPLDPPAFSPNHIISIAAPVNICPADEPKPVSPERKPWPPRRSSGGAGVRVLVIDTGLVHDHQKVPWLSQPEVDGQTSIAVDQPGVVGLANQPATPDPLGFVKQYAGHGTFVASVLRCAAPQARVFVSNALQHAGAMGESEFGPAVLGAIEAERQRAALTLGEAAARRWPDIISLSAGGTTHGQQAPLGLQSFLDQLAQHPETVLVAAAGNDGNNDNLFFPAASAPSSDGAIISVGALRRDLGGRACFSNYGQTVTAFAAGEDHVNAFLSGLYAYHHEQSTECRYHPPGLYPGCTCLVDPPYGTVVRFTGLARWSGTSFATPLVAGMIATRMSQHAGENARQAAQYLLTRLEKLTDEDQVILPVLPLGLP